jgi:hypothetical protein
MLNRFKALQLLAECTGDDIWPPNYCNQQQIPTVWIDELRDCYESGFESDSLTIYREGRTLNQFDGIRDVDLACKLGEFLGIDVTPLCHQAWSRSHLVSQIQEAVEEG